MAVSSAKNTRAKMSKGPSKNNVKKENLLVKQEVKLVRCLAGNNKKSRDRALKSLRQWLQERDKTMPFTAEDFDRIWRGLYYAMWMADKPLIQEECAENISSLLQFTSPESSLLFFKTGLQVVGELWTGIDQLRLDKFLMLIRRLLRQSLIFLRTHDWSYTYSRKYSEILSETVLSTTQEVPVGLFMHFTEIYLEEIAKITDEKLTPDKFTEFLKPFIRKLAFSTDGRIIGHIRKFVFTFLIRQTDLGLEYQERYNAWKEQGFPGSINSMKKIEVNNDGNTSLELDEKEESANAPRNAPLDPRAGRVDVELKQIKFVPKAITMALLECKFNKETNAKSRKLLDTLAEHFQKLANGVYPLGVKKVIQSDKKDGDLSIKKAVNRLVKFDKELMSKNPKRKLDTTEKGETKRRKLESKKTEDVEMNEDIAKPSLKPKNNEKRSLKKEKSSYDSLRQNEMNLKINSELNRFLTRPNFDATSIEYIFERNSGTWIVFNEKTTGKNGKQNKKCDVKATNDFVETELLDSVSSVSDEVVVKTKEDKSTTSPVSCNGINTNLDKCENVGNSKQIFPKNDWDAPLREDEIEIFIPSKKYAKKNCSITEQNEKVNQIKIQTRFSLDSKLMENNFSPKKVKFNTNLNMSQEVHEHHAQILSSPGIPFDANKKPTKTLLKVVTSSTPVNPFYNRKLSLW